MNGHNKMGNAVGGGGGLPADISKELEKRNIGRRYVYTYLLAIFLINLAIT